MKASDANGRVCHASVELMSQMCVSVKVIPEQERALLGNGKERSTLVDHQRDNDDQNRTDMEYDHVDVSVEMPTANGEEHRSCPP